MSRHVFPVMGGGSLVVGWDPPLDTYFFQEYGPPAERDPDDSPVRWEGFGGGDAIPTVEALRERVGEPLAGKITDEVAVALVLDRRYRR